MHYVDAKGILSSKNGINIYRGCTHGCIYCDSRSKCYNFQHNFEDIEVKRNAPELLDIALRKKREKCMIGTMAMSDPYIHLEEHLGLTRKCLEVVYKNGFGMCLLTKSTRLLNDLDLIKKINEETKCVVQVSMSTYDEDLCKIIEPNVSTTKERYEMLKILRDNGIPTVVWLMPFLPFINDTKENMKGLLEYCVDAEVYGILNFGVGLTLREGNREYFYKKLDTHFKGMKRKYEKTYGGSYMINSPNNDTLMKVFKETCIENNIEYKSKEIFNYLRKFPEKNEYVQLSLFD